MARAGARKKDAPRGGAFEIQPQIVRVGPKGVITIPEDNRRAMEIEPGKYLTVLQVGRSIILSPEINDFLAVAARFQAGLGPAAEGLADDLQASRQGLREELFGSQEKARSRRGR